MGLLVSKQAHQSITDAGKNETMMQGTLFFHLIPSYEESHVGIPMVISDSEDTAFHPLEI